MAINGLPTSLTSISDLLLPALDTLEMQNPGIRIAIWAEYLTDRIVGSADNPNLKINHSFPLLTRQEIIDGGWIDLVRDRLHNAVDVVTGRDVASQGADEYDEILALSDMVDDIKNSMP